MKTTLFNMKHLKEAGLLTGLALCLAIPFLSSDAHSNTVIPDDQKALLSVQGQGADPFSQITLSTGPQQILTTKADRDGQFFFSNLKYASFADLKFSIDIPPSQKGLVAKQPVNHLEFTYDTVESMAHMTGHIGQYGTLAFNLAGSKDGSVSVAGDEGYVDLMERSTQPMVAGASLLTASIINAGEICCPRMIVPSPPITLTIVSLPVLPQSQQSAPAVAPSSVPHQSAPLAVPPVKPATQNNTQPSEPVPEGDSKPAKKSNPYILLPSDKKDDQNKKQKSNIPYIVQGHLDVEPTVIKADDILAATTFSAAQYNATYVGGFKKIADEVRNATLFAASFMGAMLDSRNFMDTRRSFQVSTLQTFKNYTVSDQVCRFGTLSRSLSSADSVARQNQLAFSKILADRDTQKAGTIYSDVAQGGKNLHDDFKKKYCSQKDNNGFLEDYCNAATATSDQVYNRDVDFTRVFDVPLTLDVSFSDNSSSSEKESVLALFHNLSKIPPYMSEGKSSFDPRSNSKTVQDLRALSAMKTVSANSFAALVAEKTKASAQSAAYMQSVLVELGLSNADASKLLGANPSYFAQMEVMTKKLFQNPAFYANLYDSEANVDRQRVAMKAIELQQDRDFLESLRRREMVLSVLLNAKLEKQTNRASDAGAINK